VFHVSFTKLSIKIKDRKINIKNRPEKFCVNNNYIPQHIHNVKNSDLNKFTDKLINTLKCLQNKFNIFK